MFLRLTDYVSFTDNIFIFTDNICSHAREKNNLKLTFWQQMNATRQQFHRFSRICSKLMISLCVWESNPIESVSKYEYNAVIAEYAWIGLSFLFQCESVADNSSIDREARPTKAMGWQFWIFNCWLDWGFCKRSSGSVAKKVYRGI